MQHILGNPAWVRRTGVMVVVAVLAAVGAHTSVQATAAGEAAVADDTTLLLLLHANEAGRLVAPLSAPTQPEAR